MAGVYKKVEVVGTSAQGFTEAAQTAVEEAAKTIRHMNWFEVKEMRGAIKDGKVLEYQVTLNIGFKIEH